MLTRHAKAYSSHSCDENAFNIVAVLVSRNTSLARPRTWLVKVKNFCSRPRPRPRPRPWPSTTIPGYAFGRFWYSYRPYHRSTTLFCVKFRSANFMPVHLVRLFYVRQFYVRQIHVRHFQSTQTRSNNESGLWGVYAIQQTSSNSRVFRIHLLEVRWIV